MSAFADELRKELNSSAPSKQTYRYVSKRRETSIGEWWRTRNGGIRISCAACGMWHVGEEDDMQVMHCEACGERATVILDEYAPAKPIWSRLLRWIFGGKAK